MMTSQSQKTYASLPPHGCYVDKLNPIDKDQRHILYIFILASFSQFIFIYSNQKKISHLVLLFNLVLGFNYLDQ